MAFCLRYDHMAKHRNFGELKFNKNLTKKKNNLKTFLNESKIVNSQMENEIAQISGLSFI